MVETPCQETQHWSEKGDLNIKGAAKITERDEDHVPEIEVQTTLG